MKENKNVNVNKRKCDEETNCLCYFTIFFYFFSLFHFTHASVSSFYITFLITKIKKPVAGALDGGGPMPWHNG